MNQSMENIDFKAPIESPIIIITIIINGYRVIFRLKFIINENFGHLNLAKMFCAGKLKKSINKLMASGWADVNMRKCGIL